MATDDAKEPPRAVTDPTSKKPQLIQPSGRAAVNIPVTLVDSKGKTVGAAFTDLQGRINIPPAIFPDVASLQFSTVGLGQVTVPMTGSGPVVAPAPTPEPHVHYFGQVIGPNGSGLGGVAIRLQDGDTIAAATVSDPNGAWTATCPLGAAGTQRTLHVDPLPALAVEVPPPGGVVGPLYSQLTAVPSTLADRAPASALLSTDPAVAIEIIRRAPQLWSRGVSTSQGSPCNPYAPTDAALDVRTFAHIVLLPATQDSNKAGIIGTVSSNFSAALALGIIEKDSTAVTIPRLRYGLLLEIRQTWQGLGLALGELLYSLPLAPCEKVNLAIIEWEAAHQALRLATTHESATEDASTTRNRAVDNVVKMHSEKQAQQSSVGASLSASYMGITAAAAITHQWGSEVTSSTAQSSQNLMDAIQQSAAAERDSRMTTFVQVSESEKTNVSTRAVSNHNHAHTLTIQYFEVLQRYLVSNRVVGVQPAVLVGFRPLAFGAEDLDRHGEVIADTLRDPSLKPDLDQWLTRFAPDVQPQTPPPTTQTPPSGTSESTPAPVMALVLDVQIPEDWRDEVGGAKNMPDNLRDGLRLVFPDGKRHQFDTSVDLQDHGPAEGNWWRELTLNISSLIPLAKLAGLELINAPPDSDASWREMRFSHVMLFAVANDGSRTTLHSSDRISLPPGNTLHLVDPAPAPAPTPPSSASVPPPPTQPSPRLIAHLQANALYYTAAIITRGDPLLRWWLLSQIVDTDGHHITDIADIDPIAVLGCYLVLPLASLDALPKGLLDGIPADVWSPAWYAGADKDAIVVLPTGGTYAEAQLGTCSASEKIDDTLFWRWEQSPCPDDAVAITDEMVKSRIQDMTNLLAFANPTLTAPLPAVPEEPNPINIPDATLQELAKGLNLGSASDVLNLLGRLAELAAGHSPSSGSPGSSGTAGGSPSGTGSSGPSPSSGTGGSPGTGTGGGAGTGSGAGAGGSGAGGSSPDPRDTYEASFTDDLPPGGLSPTADRARLADLAQRIRDNSDRLSAINIEAQVPPAGTAPASMDLENERAVVIRDAIANAVGVPASSLPFHIYPSAGGRSFLIHLRYSS